MLRVLVSTLRSNLDHMPMALLVVWVPILWIRLWNKSVNYLSTKSALGQAMDSSQPTQMVSVLSVQSSDQKGNQQPGRNKKKGKKNHKGGNRNENANSNDKNYWNDGGDKQLKRKVKFPCKLCKDDHLTHLCPQIDEASRFIAQGLAVLTNPLPHNQNMN